MLNSDRQLLGTPWRGNLRSTINKPATTKDFVENLLELCRVDVQALVFTKATLAIDTPLGFSKPFIDLITLGLTAPSIGVASENPYLHRQTEHFLFTKGLSPLSPIKDMIGSQATKGMHVLGRFAPTRTSCGVWTDGELLQAIEAYPSACKRSASVELLRSHFYRDAEAQGPTGTRFISELEHVDQQDALTCALLGWMFVHEPDALVHPIPGIEPREGWIFVPADGLS